MVAVRVTGLGFLLCALLAGCGGRGYSSRKSVFRIQCTNHLRSLGQLAMSYAPDHRDWFPVASGESPRAHSSLQILVDQVIDARDPRLFVCPGGKEKPAQQSGKGERFTLTEDNVSYAWRSRPLRTSGGAHAKTPLACDKSLDNHNGQGICVIYLDGSVEFLSKEELGAGGVEEFLLKHNLSK